MRPFQVLSLACAALTGLFIPSATAARVEDLFVVDFTTDERGGSSSYGRERLQEIVDESILLAQITWDTLMELDRRANADGTLSATAPGRMFEAFFSGTFSSLEDRRQMAQGGNCSRS
ncbi:hypothetical protein HJFPF1_02449 [Paramyrothecium foliicola]|nr:hypothetical protein HJFPF1_02449 [Paramyrothecium foliicola]